MKNELIEKMKNNWTAWGGLSVEERDLLICNWGSVLGFMIESQPEWCPPNSAWLATIKDGDIFRLSPSFSLPEPVVAKDDPVSHPSHYTTHPSGIECIQVVEHMGFNLGNALKYIWRCDLKLDAVEDLKKAQWYIERELIKRQGEV